ncbi:ribonuclease HII [Tannockella kyphosi]|uniref:ribonuclease HII n=1 Tax=Tannockella kyphosi TaxID=2899121 RepID=UPI002012FCB2|nr:ribonuclease HII [Tannockella kyphosi]
MGTPRNQYELEYYAKGYQAIIGLDEAGRGPMAGELVVAGVIFPKHFYDERINDSKKLTKKKRDELFSFICDNAIAYHIEVISVADVDKLNVYQASKIGMEKCVQALQCEGLFALTDAMPLHYLDHLSIIKGDQLSISIAGASILAKVTRDRMMEEHDKTYPEYGFASHKGYVTKKHIQALDEFGVTPIHRKSFKPVLMRMEKQLSFDI